MEIGEKVYEIVISWSSINKNTIGYQLLRSVDSISANISEGYGRFSFKEQKRFCYIARGSLYETRTWLEKSKIRVQEDEISINETIAILDVLHKKLNAYIKYIDTKIQA